MPNKLSLPKAVRILKHYLKNLIFEKAKTRKHLRLESRNYGILIQKSKPGLAWHSAGWPLGDTYGGSFYIISMATKRQLAMWWTGLQQPYLSPFEEFQRFKTTHWRVC